MEETRNALGLPPACQVGFVYPDLGKAIALYEPLFGHFEVIDYGQIEGAHFRGKPSTYRIKMGIAYTGDLELELIEWVSGETPHKEFLDQGRSGMHHMSFHVPDLDAVVEQSRSLGYEPIWYHRMSEEIAYTYLERPGDPLLVELTERPWSGGNVQLDAPAP